LGTEAFLEGAQICYARIVTVFGEFEIVPKQVVREGSERVSSGRQGVTPLLGHYNPKGLKARDGNRSTFVVLLVFRLLLLLLELRVSEEFDPCICSPVLL
jgi:hypothetical protein